MKVTAPLFVSRIPGPFRNMIGTDQQLLFPNNFKPSHSSRRKDIFSSSWSQRSKMARPRYMTAFAASSIHRVDFRIDVFGLACQNLFRNELMKVCVCEN